MGNHGRTAKRPRRSDELRGHNMSCEPRSQPGGGDGGLGQNESKVAPPPADDFPKCNPFVAPLFSHIFILTCRDFREPFMRRRVNRAGG